MSDARPAGRVAVVGAGIAGLAAAHRLTELASGTHVAVFEKSSRAGGVIETVHEQGFQVEQSADNFITTLPYGLDLCRRLGLADQLVQTNPECRRTYIVHRGRLHTLPDGFLMLAPTRMWPLALTPLLSPWGKLRAAMEYFIPARTDAGDESMAAFATRRLGREAFERLVEPLVGAVYAADMETLSVDATLPRFREMERNCGSLIRAMRHNARRIKGSGVFVSPATRFWRLFHKQRLPTPLFLESGARHSLFVTLRDGLGSLVEAIVGRLPAGALRLSAPVERIDRAENGTWRVRSRRGEETFDTVILATPSYVSSELLATVDAELAEMLGRVEHSGTAVVSVGFDRAQIAHRLDAAGAVVGRIEKSPILAVSFSSQKYPHRAPPGKAVFRVFVGGSRAPEMAEMEDDRLLAIVLDELRGLLGITGEPCYARVAHWPRTMPQYHLGHRELVERIESRVAQLPGLALAGNAYHGVGVPDCIHSGEVAAERLLR